MLIVNPYQAFHQAFRQKGVRVSCGRPILRKMMKTHKANNKFMGGGTCLQDAQSASTVLCSLVSCVQTSIITFTILSNHNFLLLTFPDTKLPQKIRPSLYVKLALRLSETIKEIFSINKMLNRNNYILR